MPSHTTHNTPALRFPGYTGVWEQHKLEEYASFLTGHGLSKADLSPDGKQECILYGNLYTDYGMIADKVVNKTNAHINNPVYSKFGDVLIPASDTTPTGLARATSIERSNVLLGGDINIIRPHDDINGSCLSLALNVNRKELIRLIRGTTVKHIHNSEIKNIELCMPQSLEEQIQIAVTFKTLDDRINLHQRQTQKLTELKQGLLQNMFPREGESVPRLRFPGFTTKWKQQKLGDIYNFHYGEFNNNPDNNGPYPVYGANGIIGGYTKFNAEDSSIIGHIGAAGYVKWGMGKHFVTYNGTIAKPAASSLDSKFGYYALSNKKIYKICAGSGRPFVSYADLNSIDMRIPNDLLEQKKISLLFTRLDDLLALHEQYIVKLTQLKKGLLQKMFPQD